MLADLEDADLVADAAATVLEVTRGPGESVRAALSRVCRNRQMLVVLDNCEHVIDAVVDLVDSLLLGAGDGVRVLATSQERLGIPGESVHQLLGLAVPPDSGLVAASDLKPFDSVQLFSERASAVRAGFEVTEANWEPVAAIWRGLDGIPLAIELAASRLDALSAREVAAGLDDRFATLGGGWQRGRALRQQTLEAVIDWVWTGRRGLRAAWQPR